MTVGSVPMQQLRQRMRDSRERMAGTLPIPPGQSEHDADQQLQRSLLTEAFKLHEQNRLLYEAMRREIGTEDLLMQMSADYFTLGTEPNFSLTLPPQSRQQMRIKGFALGCIPGTDGAASAIQTLITTGVYGYVQIHRFAVNFNVPSVTETKIDILANSEHTFKFYMATASGNFPADLHFFGFMWGCMVPTEGVVG